MWMNSLILDTEEKRQAAFELVASSGEYDRRLSIIESNIEYFERELRKWLDYLEELEKDLTFDNPVHAFEKIIDRDLTTEEWNGTIPIGWDGTVEEYKEWEKNEQQRNEGDSATVD